MIRPGFQVDTLTEVPMLRMTTFNWHRDDHVFKIKTVDTHGSHKGDISPLRIPTIIHPSIHPSIPYRSRQTDANEAHTKIHPHSHSHRAKKTGANLPSHIPPSPRLVRAEPFPPTHARRDRNIQHAPPARARPPGAGGRIQLGGGEPRAPDQQPRQRAGLGPH